MGRRDGAVLPVIESNSDLGVAGACRLRNPNRAVQIDPSATPL